MEPGSGASMGGPGQVPDDACLRCGSRIETCGEQEFRTGGTSGGWKLVFGELAELGEGKARFEVLACRSCGHVEFRLPRSR